MSDREPAETPSNPKPKLAEDDKDAIAEQLARGADAIPEHPTRSTLHSGEHFEGEVTERLDRGGDLKTESVQRAETVDLEAMEEGAEPFTLSEPTDTQPSPASLEESSTSNTVDRERDIPDKADFNQSEFVELSGPVDDQTQFSSQSARFDLNSGDGQAIEHNLGPEGLQLSSTQVAENAVGALIGQINVIDPDAGDRHSFAVSDARFEVVDGALRLKPGIALDHEEAAQIEIEVTVTDRAGASLTENFIVEVSDINEGPEAVTLAAATVKENAAGALIGQINVIDPDAGDSHSITVSDARFEVVDGALRLKPGIALDHEDAAPIEIQVTATDGGGMSFTENFTVDVADLNEAPEAITLSGSAVAENAAGAVIGEISVVDPDDGESHSFTVSDARFEVVNGALKLKPGIVLDHEEAAQIEVDVTATDSGGVSLSERFTINVTDINEAPESLTIEAVPTAALSLNEGEGMEDVALLQNMADFPTDALTMEMRFQSVDPAPTHGVSLFSYAADTGHNNEFLVWCPKGADGPLTVFVAGKMYKTDIDAGDVLDGQSHDLAVTWDQARGQLKVFVDGEEAATKTTNARALKTDGTISLGQEQDREAGRFDDNQIFEGQISEVRLFDHVRTSEEISDASGAPLADPAGMLGLLLNWTMQEATGGVISDQARNHDLVLGGDAHLVDTGAVGPGLSVAENAAGALIGQISVIDPDDGDSHSFTVSDDRFEVVDGALRLKSGVVMDHEDAAQIEIDVIATDSGGASFTESFTINVADLNETPEAITLTGSAVAENVAGAVIGQISVADPDDGENHDFSVSDDRFEVVDGALRLKPGVALDREDAAQIEVDVTVTDSGGDSLTESFTVEVLDAPEFSLSSGFHAKYFDVDHKLTTLDDIDWTAPPTHEEVTSEINYANGSGSFWEGGSKDTFGAQISGTVDVEEAGTFTFHLGGDDGAMLFVDGQPIIDNDGLHGFRTRSGEIELEPGPHHIEVRYFENTGSAGLKLEWDGPGLDGRELVTAPESDAIQTVSGLPATLNLDFDPDALGADGTLTLEGMPAGTVVTAGNQTATSDGLDSLDITGWETHLLQITPPSDFVGQIEGHISANLPVSTGATIVHQMPLSIEVGAVAIEPPTASFVGGFTASYFDVDHRLDRIDDIDWDSGPTHQEIIQEIDYQNGTGSFWEGGSRDTFGTRIEGEIKVEEGGTYTFFAGADDGVVLLINGETVVDNDGRHGFRTRTGDIELAPGTYEIEVRYFENTGHAGLRVEWEGPDTDGRELIRPDASTEIDADGTFQLGIDTGAASDQASVSLVGLPADTIIISGEHSAVSDGSEVDLSGWAIDQLEISPPLGFEGTIEGEILIEDVAFNGANVTGATPFSLSVGDPEASMEPPEPELIKTDLSDGSGAAASDTDWASLGPDEPEMDDGDALSEPVIEQINSDIADIGLDTYERVDW